MQVDVISEPDVWRTALSEFDTFDFVHTYDYHAANEAIGDGSPLAFIVKQGGVTMSFWPCLLRYIDGTDQFDLTSVYSYGGPVVKPNADERACLELTFEAMRSRGAVSLFSRLHPLFPSTLNDGVFQGQRLSDVVVIEMNDTDDPTKAYRGSHRREIVNARRAGLSTYVVEGIDARRDFVDIYSHAMREVGAKPYYLFNERFFDALLNAADFRTRVIFAEFEGRRVASAMFTTSCGIMQYFLSGALNETRKLAPAKAIIAHAHQLAVSERLKTIVLGGGVGSSQDALFKFKAGFSNQTRPFRILKRIFNTDAYQLLCLKNSILPNTDFFPAYRAPRN